MERKTLDVLLNEKGNLESGMLVSSTLIKEIEVCGFINSSIPKSSAEDNILGLYLSLANKAPYRQVVRSNYIYQVVDYIENDRVKSKGIVLPIYKTLSICKEDFEMNLEDITIPKLEPSPLYKKIHKRLGGTVKVTEYMIQKANYPDYIEARDGKAIVNIHAGNTICLDREGCIKSLGQNIMALCRYIHTETGTMCYTQYSLDELYIDEQ